MLRLPHNLAALALPTTTNTSLLRTYLEVGTYLPKVPNPREQLRLNSDSSGKATR